MSGKDEGRDRAFWSEVRLSGGITGNARWELNEARTNPRVKQELVLPIYVALVPTAQRKLREFIEFLSGATDQYSVPDHVMDRLQTEAARADHQDGPDAPILMSLISRVESVESKYWTVVSIGQPMARLFRDNGFSRGTGRPAKTGRLSRRPVVGIIDDSLGFLNHRFRRANGKTRFDLLWIMHNDVLAGDPGPHNPVASGIELTASHINAHLASDRSEMAIYRQINNGVFGPAVRHGTAFHAGHGTHVLDLAAGAEPGEPMSEVPIIGVQLSPASIGETSGAALDPDLIRGFERIIEHALSMKGRFPLVINISLGSLAGPLDGTSPVERAILAGMQRYHRASGHAPIRVVIAFGNAHKSRLVAEATLKPGDTTTLAWRILPDDTTKSVLELRTPAGLAADLTLSLTPPDGGNTLVLGQWPSGAVVHQYIVPSGVACEILNDVETDPVSLVALRDKLQITVAPTLRHDLRPVACAGAWQLTVGNTGAASATVGFRVQRDDTPGGYRRNGRQSWLDHASGWEWEDERRAYLQPGSDSPIRRQNTEVSYAGFEHPSVYFVGAARPNHVSGGPPAADSMRPSTYSAEGGLPMPDGPTVSARGDDGAVLKGVAAAGVLTGTTTRMSGTSMAAPAVTRRLLDYAMTGGMTASVAGAHDSAELNFVLGAGGATTTHAQLGQGTALPA
jgi:hypothetical protein